MINLNTIVQSAQGGQAVDNLASRFGISPTEAQSAIDALLPAFRMGLQNRVQSGDGLGTILNHLNNGAHQEVYNDAGAVQSGAATTAGTSVLGDLFGGQHTSSQVAQQASTESGVPTSIIQAMLPVIASMIMGGLLHSAQSGGLGGILSQVLGSLGGQGGLGSNFGRATDAGQNRGTDPGTAQEGGLGGLIGSVLGGLLGGTQQSASTRNPFPGSATQEIPDDEPVSNAGLTGSSADATLDDLSRMFQSGTPVSPQHEANLASILGR